MRVKVISSPLCLRCNEIVLSIVEVCKKLGLEVEEISCFSLDGSRLMNELKIEYVPAVVVAGRVYYPRSPDEARKLICELKS